MELSMRIELTKMMLDILKLKANDHDWCCYVPQDVKDDLDKMLLKIKESLQTGYLTI